MPPVYSSSPSSNTSGSGNSSLSSATSQGKSQGPKKPPIIHNTGGRTYDDIRRADWDGAKWK
ncbi:hypothetical protein VTO42DRAFT_7654 [Malbranchea cinnamomea]